MSVLACQWRRISQEEPFVGRCDEVVDELGSAVVAARLVRDLMRLWRSPAAVAALNPDSSRAAPLVTHTDGHA